MKMRRLADLQQSAWRVTANLHRHPVSSTMSTAKGWAKTVCQSELKKCLFFHLLPFGVSTIVSLGSLCQNSALCIFMPLVVDDFVLSCFSIWCWGGGGSCSKLSKCFACRLICPSFAPLCVLPLGLSVCCPTGCFATWSVSLLPHWVFCHFACFTALFPAKCLILFEYVVDV